MSALGNSRTVLAADVADGATVAVPYPAGLAQADLTDSTGGVVAVGSNDVWPQGTGDGTVAMAFGASNVTVTNNSGITWPAGAEIIASFGQVDINGSYNLTYPKQVQDAVADLEDRMSDLENA